MTGNLSKSIALAGYGAIGQKLADRLRTMPAYRLTAVSARDHDKAKTNLNSLGIDDVPVRYAHELAKDADIVVECAPSEIFCDIAEPVIKSGKTLIVLSSGALLANWHLVGLAEEAGGQILVPSGALVGLDAVQGAAQGHIDSVRMKTTKPPAALQGAPYFDEVGIALDEFDAPRLVFEGTAREAVKAFPANVNVVVALSLAGIGPDRTTISIWTDPAAERNAHDIEVLADSVRLNLRIENVPTSNAKTGRLTALSVIALLNKLASPLRVGT